MVIVQSQGSRDPRSTVVIAAYRPHAISEAAAVFAREWWRAAAPASPARARALLFCAGRLAAFGESVGLQLSAEVLLSEATIERFIACGTAGLSPASVRTMRTNLRGLPARLRVIPPRGRWRCPESARRRHTPPRRSTGICAWRPPVNPSAGDARQRADLPGSRRGDHRGGASRCARQRHPEPLRRGDRGGRERRRARAVPVLARFQRGCWRRPPSPPRA